MKKLALILFYFVISPFLTFSDSAAYKGIANISIESENYIIEHYHDWSINNAYIECIDKKTRDIVFKISSPALTKLFVSNDEQFIVGLSNIKIDNPYQFVMLNLKGEYIIRSHVRRFLRKYYQTVTNYIYWFNEKDPELEFIYKNNELVGISVLNFDMNDLIVGKSDLDYNKNRVIIDINKLKRNNISIFSIIVILVAVCILFFIKIISSRKPNVA